MRTHVILSMAMALLGATWSAGPISAAGERSERRTSQDSDEFRTEIRQRRLKKVDELDELKLPQDKAPPKPSTDAKPKQQN